LIEVALWCYAHYHICIVTPTSRIKNLYS